MVQDDDPNWLRYTVRADGSRRVLRRGHLGRCLFLTQTGCALMMDARPLVCRLYPFDYTEKGLIGILAECPEHLLEPGETLIETLGMSYQEANKWWGLLYNELRTELPVEGELLHEYRIDLRFAASVPC
jgi:Fe-S-cluster containining protein